MRILNEGRKEFLSWANVSEHEERAKNLLNDFLANRQKFPSPENNMDWWIKNKTPLALHAYIANFKSKSQKEKEQRLEGADKLYDKNGWVILRIKTYEAAVQYGKGTKWCICGNYPDHENRGNYYFNHYLEDYYKEYLFYINNNIKPESSNNGYINNKWCVCPNKNNNGVVIWGSADDQPEFIPGAPYVKGLPDVGQFSITEEGALVGCKGVRDELVLPAESRSVKHNLMMGKRFSSLKLNDGLKSIESGAFTNCGIIGRLEIPDSVELLGKGCFGANDITSAVIGSGVKGLPPLLFAYCESLNKVTIKGDISSIGERAFESCPIKQVYINDGVDLRLFTGKIPDDADIIGLHTGELYNRNV